jgi:hypothetical protein
MNEKKIFAYKILLFALLFIFAISIKLWWLIALLGLGLIFSIAYDLRYYTKYRSLPRFDDIEMASNAKRAARNSFIIILLLIMGTMVYLDLYDISIEGRTIITPMFTFALFIFFGNFLYYKYNLNSRDRSRDYYLPRILSLVATCFAFSIVANSFDYFNITNFFVSLIPGILVLLLTLLSWKKEAIGGLIFLVLGTIFSISLLVLAKMGTWLIFGLMLITTGFLFIISKLRD